MNSWLLRNLVCPRHRLALSSSEDQIGRLKAYPIPQGRFREGVGFEVRYWSLPALKDVFTRQVGDTTFSVDCFFGIGLQGSDLRFMPPVLKAAVSASEALRHASRVLPPLKWLADSVHVHSSKRGKA